MTLDTGVPDELLALLQRSRLASRDAADHVKVALATHLYLEGLISIGEAAETTLNQPLHLGSVGAFVETTP